MQGASSPLSLNLCACPLADILLRLAEAEGDITDDRELIEGLESAKRISTEVAEKSVVVQRTTLELNVTAEKYRAVAHRASLLFFFMSGLYRVHSVCLRAKQRELIRFIASALRPSIVAVLHLLPQRLYCGVQPRDR